MKKSIALGCFDGLHIGHTAVINETLRPGLTPHILQLEFPSPRDTTLITTSLKQKILDEKGISPLNVSFDEIRNMSALEFFTEYIIKKWDISLVSCGGNFTFGKDKCGNSEVLAGLCEKYGVELAIAPDVMYDGSVVSSTRIRNCLRDGDIENANSMLGRAFSYDFPVMTGDKIGRTLGFPTINQLFTANYTIPAYGVYASEVCLDRIYKAVTSIGPRPTFGLDEIRSETHIPEFCGDLYSQNVEVRLLRYIRPLMKFSSRDQLINQIKEDIKAI